VQQVISKSFCKILYGQNVFVCVSGNGKSLRVKNASLLMVDTHKRKPMTAHPCALGSRRVEKNSKTCLSSSARAIFTHTWTSASTYCLAHRHALAIRVTARASRLSMFSRRESEGKKHFQSFRWISNMLHYIPLLLIYGKSTFAYVNNL